MKFSLAKHYTRDQIREVLGGNPEEYLPTRKGRVVCGAFRPDANPDAPMVILPGFGPRIEKTAEIFAGQSFGVPVFLKRATNSWQLVGYFRVQRLSKDPSEIARHASRAQREGDVSMVLFLERVSEEPAG